MLFIIGMFISLVVIIPFIANFGASDKSTTDAPDPYIK
jgi:hypothetical protein